MDVECTLNSYGKDSIATTILKVSNAIFDGHKVRLTVVTQDGEKLCLNVVGDELISAVQRCMLDWRGW